jgi:hypothetical protein
MNTLNTPTIDYTFHGISHSAKQLNGKKYRKEIIWTSYVEQCFYEAFGSKESDFFYNFMKILQTSQETSIKRSLQFACICFSLLPRDSLFPDCN